MLQSGKYLRKKMQKRIIEALDSAFESSDVNSKTIREYLCLLLQTLWKESDGFSGKRPFGNGAWQYDVYKSLIKNKFISGNLDEDGYVEEVDTKEADKFVQEMIKEMCSQ